jgi:hypothetical protein
MLHLADYSAAYAFPGISGGLRCEIVPIRVDNNRFADYFFDSKAGSNKGEPRFPEAEHGK